MDINEFGKIFFEAHQEVMNKDYSITYGENTKFIFISCDILETTDPRNIRIEAKSINNMFKYATFYYSKEFMLTKIRNAKILSFIND